MQSNWPHLLVNFKRCSYVQQDVSFVFLTSMNYIVLIIALLFRLVATGNPLLAGVSPLFALAFLSSKRDIGLVLVSNAVVDGVISYQYGIDAASFMPTMFAASYYLLSKTPVGFYGFVFGGTAIHYLITNTLTWMYSPLYDISWSSWVLCNTFGDPSYPPTYLFFVKMALGNAFFFGVFRYLDLYQMQRRRAIVA